MLNKKKKKKGFTLIELIIVISIIAVLAAIAMPKFGQIRTNANIKADIATAKNIYSAITAKVQENSLTSISSSDIAGVIDGENKSKVDPNKSFNVRLDSEKNVVVHITGTNENMDITNGTNQIYPKPTTTTNNIWYGGTTLSGGAGAGGGTP